MKTKNILPKLIKKARQSLCRYKVAAIGFDKRGNIVGSAMNRPRLDKYHGGLHAEMALLLKYGIQIKSIVICRVNRSGKLCPIVPCATCSRVAKALHITITTIH